MVTVFHRVTSICSFMERRTFFHETTYLCFSFSDTGVGMNVYCMTEMRHSHKVICRMASSGMLQSGT
jgi:hypothetical protein